MAASRQASGHAPISSVSTVEFTAPPLVAKNGTDSGPVVDVGGSGHTCRHTPWLDAFVAAPTAVPFMNSCTVLLGRAVPEKLSWLAQVAESPTMPVSGEKAVMVVGIGVGADVGVGDGLAVG